MNTVLKVSAAGALTLAGAAAHASIALPSSGSSDAILFAEVVNAAGTAAVASYAGDTGVSINSIINGTGAGTYLASDANLQKLFAADAAGDTLYWGVQGAQYPANASVSTPGAFQFITTTASDSVLSLKGDNSASLNKFATLNADIGQINTNSGGASSIEGSNPATAGLWDVTGGSLNTAFWDGGNTATYNLIGGTQKLFYVTAGSPAGTTTKVAYASEGTAYLSASGVTLAASGTGGSTVPLPAAVWLLGSGLLGLAGVSRRRSKA